MGGQRSEVDVSATDVQVQEETEHERVARWRAEELERAGYEVSAVAVLAAASDVDLHLAIDLLHRGCSEELALQILL
jgi:hypothetical protein